MLMPKAAMNEDDLLAGWKGEIGRAGEIATVQAKPVTEAMNEASNKKLRLRILLPDASHSPANMIFRADRHQASPPFHAETTKGAGIERPEGQRSSG
jgi:hypothetical protein